MNDRRLVDVQDSDGRARVACLAGNEGTSAVFGVTRMLSQRRCYAVRIAFAVLGVSFGSVMSFAVDPPNAAKPEGGAAATKDVGAASAPSDDSAATTPNGDGKIRKSAGRAADRGHKANAPRLPGRVARQFRYLSEQVRSQTTMSDSDKDAVCKKLDHFASRMESGLYEAAAVYDGGYDPADENADGPAPRAGGGRRRTGVNEKPIASPLASHMPFLADLEASLNAEARPQFQAVTKRWNILRYRGGPDGELSRMMRALRDPLLGLSEEKSESLRDQVGSIMRSVKRERGDRGVMDVVAKEAWEKVNAGLTEEQLKRYKETLAEMAREREAEEANGRALAAKWNTAPPRPLNAPARPGGSSSKPATGDEAKPAGP